MLGISGRTRAPTDGITEKCVRPAYVPTVEKNDRNIDQIMRGRMRWTAGGRPWDDLTANEWINERVPAALYVVHTVGRAPSPSLWNDGNTDRIPTAILYQPSKIMT